MAAADDDDEISILTTTPAAFKSRRTTIDLTEDDDKYDVVLLETSPTKRRRRFYKGESSKSKQRVDDDDDTVLRRSFICEICTDEKPISDSFRIIGCNHCYCTECISNYVAAKLQDNISRITCPVPRCGGFLELPHCRTILPKAVLERWGDALCEATMLAEEKFYRPFKNCSVLLIDDDRNNKKLGKDETSNEDIMLMKLAKINKWIRCPKCRFYVSKSEGCLYMLCRCGHAFCYKCGAQRKQHVASCTNCAQGRRFELSGFQL